MFNLYTGWGELLVAFSIASFYINLYWEAGHPSFDAVYGIWDEFTQNAASWLGLFLTLSCILILDTAGRVLRSTFMHLIWHTTLLDEEYVAMKMLTCDKKSDDADILDSNKR